MLGSLEAESETEICIYVTYGGCALGRNQEGNEEKRRGQRNDLSRMWFLERSSFSSVLWGALERNCTVTLSPHLGQGSGAYVTFSLLVSSHRIQGKDRASMVQLQAPVQHKKVQETKDNPHRCKPLAGAPTATRDLCRTPTASSI